jgi:protein arginine kinase
MLLDAERGARESRYAADPDRWIDACHRAEGVLRHAHLLSASELLTLSGKLRCGIALGILRDMRMEDLNRLLVEAMPATLTLSADPHPKDERGRDILRAKTVRARLFGA